MSRRSTKQRRAARRRSNVYRALRYVLEYHKITPDEYAMHKTHHTNFYMAIDSFLSHVTVAEMFVLTHRMKELRG